jgi:hypothetical protein
MSSLFPPASITPPVRIDIVCVTWREQWELDRYLEHYARTRRQSERVLDRAALLECLARYPGTAPFRKSDLDYFLDANLSRIRR